MNRLAPVACGLLLLSSGYGMAQDQAAPEPMVVTTDTAAYCRILSKQIAAQGTLPAAVQSLQSEGSDLCHEGRVRSGINRLRRALMVLHSVHAASSTDQDDNNTPRD